MADLIPKISIKPVTTIEKNMAFSDARFSADGQSVLTKCKTGYERWDAKTGVHLSTPELHDPDLNILSDQALEKIGYDTLDEKTNKAVGNHFNGWADLVTISPNKRYVAIGSNDGFLGVVDLLRDMPLILNGHTTSMNNHLHQNSINTMLFDSSSTYLVSVAEEDCDPLLWDLTAASKEKIWNQRSGRLFDQPVKIKDFMPSLFSTIAFNPTEPKFVTTHPTIETTQVWEIERTKHRFHRRFKCCSNHLNHKRR